MEKIESIRNVFAKISELLLGANVNNGEKKINLALEMLGKFA